MKLEKEERFVLRAQFRGIQGVGSLFFRCRYF